MINYENLYESNKAYLDELEQAAKRVVRSGWYILGKEVEVFEEQFANFIGAKHCIGVGNGLDALSISLQALKLPSKSEVIVTSNSYIATILAILAADLKPIFVEPDLLTFNIDTSLIAEKITPNTSAICVTHLFGKSCRMDEVTKLAREYNLKIIEDCAQSHGAKFKDQMTGTFGNAGCFSFYPTKNLGALGDAGAIVTNDDQLADIARCIRNYGSVKKYENTMVGVNSRLDPIQAAFLRVKLRYINDITMHKRGLAQLYFENLPDWLILPRQKDDEFDVFHIFAVRSGARDDLREWLLTNGVNTEIHYPIPPHKQLALRNRIHEDSFPLSEEHSNTQISLPISPGTTREEALKICDILHRAPSCLKVAV